LLIAVILYFLSLFNTHTHKPFLIVLQLLNKG
jgi:hypothetical protein